MRHMSSIADSSLRIQTCSQSVPSPLSWFGEVTLLAYFLQHQEVLWVLHAIAEHVHFARRRFGRYDVIDFVAILIGYAASSERTIEPFYQRVAPFTTAFMSLQRVARRAYTPVNWGNRSAKIFRAHPSFAQKK